MRIQEVLFKKVVKSKKGFTLPELIIYMGLFSIIFMVILQLFISTLDVQSESQATSTIQQDGRFLITRLSYDIKRAQTITTPSSIGASSSSLLIVINGTNYTYSLNNGNLELTNNFGTTNLNGYDSNITSLSFTRFGNPSGRNSIRIDMTLASRTRTGQGEKSENYQTTIGLRPN